VRGERRRHGYDCLASFYRFARQDAQERTPPGVRDALCHVVIPEHVGRLQVFVIDRVVRLHQRQRRLVLEVYPRPSHPLVCSGEQADRLATAMTIFDPSRDAPLSTPQVALSSPVDARVGDGLPISQRGKRLQAQVDAGLLAGQ
jgi:hypothetical protein